MNDYPIEVETIASWIASKEALWKGMGISLAGLKQNFKHVPSGCADLDCFQTMGRVSFWVTGQFDLEVLRTSDGQITFLRHVQTLNAPSLDVAFTKFLNAMSNPSGINSASDQHSLGA
ncbi:immunity protein TriTu family protein [Granulicella aggregans]|uniref:immunity protein TriTu family protein n=1 Tax=Granulicella aggregans TaxID=474949 RepID=UPI0021E0CD92|nr:hypothetical protein [Granulicella aggregans]